MDPVAIAYSERSVKRVTQVELKGLKGRRDLKVKPQERRGPRQGVLGEVERAQGAHARACSNGCDGSLGYWRACARARRKAETAGPVARTGSMGGMVRYWQCTRANRPSGLLSVTLSSVRRRSELNS
jgi:hypothetical protein